MRNINRFAVFNVDMVFPHIILTFCLRGSAKAMFDMKLYTHSKYDIALLLPGHIMRPIECTDDYQYTAIYISAKLFDDLKLQTFSHDYQKFKYAPLCSLTEEQANRLLVIAEQLEVIAGYTEQEMPHRYQALLAQLAVGYEFLNLFRKDRRVRKYHFFTFSMDCNFFFLRWKGPIETMSGSYTFLLDLQSTSGTLKMQHFADKGESS